MDTTKKSRPPVESRSFRSDAIEAVIERVSSGIEDPKIRLLFENCFPNTLDSTVFYDPDRGEGDSFIITGDIDAMWLRDSAAQVMPYIRFADQDAGLRLMLEGLVRRQAACIHLDAYANAFYRDPVLGEWKDDATEMRPGVHERKWELDSLVYFLSLSYQLWSKGGATACFDKSWLTAVRRVLEVCREQQGSGAPYRFSRMGITSSETTALKGIGQPSKPCGLIRSAFRPSDDSTIFPFLIPSNAFAVVALRQAAELCDTFFPESVEASECRQLADEVETAIYKFAVFDHPSGAPVLAYEVDGFGGCIFMDDANIPSLLSLPELGFIAVGDPLYQATRRLVLSEDNPFFFKGSAGEGIGGPHIGLDYVWPMGIIMRAMTSNDEAEILFCLKMLAETDAGTGFMHETFHKDDPSDFTRDWFCWTNSLFGELILRIEKDRPHLLQQKITGAEH